MSAQLTLLLAVVAVGVYFGFGGALAAGATRGRFDLRLVALVMVGWPALFAIAYWEGR